MKAISRYLFLLSFVTVSLMQLLPALHIGEQTTKTANTNQRFVLIEHAYNCKEWYLLNLD